ncbi:hypothetical protein [Cerasicoccus arenae]|uniref:Transposase n=1 Tax=Cerasicoccus arenae TaxID=424488 RepID=A0A8J3DF35_9BACT|nr:hypothetical protein [Cerasicoccus arenae]MBK1860043.1 hypothetical protein [Cerasicoccus arenae]GHC13985.1 hypothetical protein GCM10007047_34060 [Cerasicoccus arenae]
MKNLDMDLRTRMVELRGQGYSAREVAERLLISERSVCRLWRQYQSLGHVEAKQRGGYKPITLRAHEPLLRQWIEAEPDLTLDRLVARIDERLGIQVSASGLWNRLRAMKLSHKKNDAHGRTGSPGHPEGA